jgi:hypothetical protein
LVDLGVVLAEQRGRLAGSYRISIDMYSTSAEPQASRVVGGLAGKRDIGEEPSVVELLEFDHLGDGEDSRGWDTSGAEQLLPFSRRA